MSRSQSRGRFGGRLAPRLAPVLLVKVVGLGLLWFLFVRGQQVTVEARDVAASFGLGGSAGNLPAKSKGVLHGQ